ncbi:MAG: rod shape-determining protein MreC [Candidatus Margulisbacteria bacterium]|jgi:rod shape-determining protein MreC|nr:rod shape-determining protein MreC [Candidatus Margulisiibacteriota bacterium]
MHRGYFYFLRLAGALALLAALLKLLAFLPASRLAPAAADKIIYLQKLERNIERTLAGIKDTFWLLAAKREQDRQYEILCRQNLTERSLLSAARSENDRLRDALKFQRNSTSRLIPAEVVGRSGDQWFRFVTVAKGADDGVQPAMAAVDEHGLVGSVHSAGRRSARILLLSDPLVNVSVVSERTGEVYVLTGRNSNRLDLKYATVHSDIQVGDRLLTSGHSYTYRPGLPVGTVTAVRLPKNSLTKKATVKPAARLAGLDIIFLLR